MGWDDFINPALLPGATPAPPPAWQENLLRSTFGEDWLATHHAGYALQLANAAAAAGGFQPVAIGSPYGGGIGYEWVSDSAAAQRIIDRYNAERRRDRDNPGFVTDVMQTLFRPVNELHRVLSRLGDWGKVVELGIGISVGWMLPGAWNLGVGIYAGLSEASWLSGGIALANLGAVGKAILEQLGYWNSFKYASSTLGGAYLGVKLGAYAGGALLGPPGALVFGTVGGIVGGALGALYGPPILEAIKGVAVSVAGWAARSAWSGLDSTVIHSVNLYHHQVLSW